MQVLVFWETWCPYSQRAVPALEPIYERFRSSGLEVVGLTRMTRNSTEEKVRAFVRDNHVVWEYTVSSPEAIPSRMIAALVRAG